MNLYHCSECGNICRILTLSANIKKPFRCPVYEEKTQEWDLTENI